MSITIKGRPPGSAKVNPPAQFSDLASNSRDGTSRRLLSVIHSLAFAIRRWRENIPKPHCLDLPHKPLLLRCLCDDIRLQSRGGHSLREPRSRKECPEEGWVYQGSARWRWFPGQYEFGKSRCKTFNHIASIEVRLRVQLKSNCHAKKIWLLGSSGMPVIEE